MCTISGLWPVTRDRGPILSELIDDLVLSVSDFVALLNQTLEFAYPSVTITGELANVRVSKGKWLYFDLKDELASVKFFGTVYQLPGPLEDGMLVQVRGVPRLHPLYGFSVTVQHIQPSGEGAIRRAADLLQAKLTAEGLFDESRKRPLPYPPQRIGLITSSESAAYADFTKILKARWGGLDIELIDVQVQGEAAVEQIVRAVEHFNAQAQPPDILVLTRGGGSAEDLAAFSTEQVTRAVAGSRVPTLVAIGHEVDISLAELAADQRASTPSNAAELLVPDRREVLAALKNYRQQLGQFAGASVQLARQSLQASQTWLDERIIQLIKHQTTHVQQQAHLLEALSPQAILRRGYAVVRLEGKATRGKGLKRGAIVNVELSEALFDAKIEKIEEI